MTTIATLSLDVPTTIDLLLKLPPEQRLEIGERLLESIRDEEIDAAWEAEINRRIDDLEAGRGESYPASQVMAELREMLNEDD